MQLTLAVVLSIVATLVSAAVSAFAWRRREAPGATPLAAFTAATAVWTAGNALQAASTGLSAKLFWVNVQYVGTTVVPLAWFAFACEYTDREEWLTRRTLVALAIPGVVTFGLAWTNDYHHLVRTASEVVTVGGAAELRRTFGPAFWVALVYSNLVNGLGTVLLLRGLVESRDAYRGQTLAILTGATVPWVAATLFYNGLSPVEPEVFSSVTGVAFAYAVARHDLLDVTPVARRTVVEEMDDPVLVLDADDRIVDANPAAGRLFGWLDGDDPVGRTVADACAACPSFVERYDDDPDVGDVSVEGADDVHRHFDVQASSLSDRSGSASGTVLIFKDVTARERYEERLEHQNEYLEQVGRNIAHDIRNPLNVAQGHLEFARDGSVGDCPLDEDDHLDKVANAHERMDDIVGEVLGMAQTETPIRADHLSLERTARDAWQNVETGDADLEFDGSDPSVVADRRQLTSVFENLFRNAVEHAGPDATIRVGAIDDPERDGAGFYVADDGPGVPESEREQVFDRGFTTRAAGTGVGLAVIRDIVERHGWSVGVTETETGGARFEIRGVTVAATPVR